MHAAGGIDVVAGGQMLTQAMIDPVVDQAISHWAAGGVASHRLSTLSNVNIQVADLSSSLLGMASSSDMIWVDRDAAGFGWGSAGVDLLSVVAHELGHKLGFEHASGHDVMAATLAPGVRQLPSSSPLSGQLSHDAYGSANHLPVNSRPFDELLSLWGNSESSGAFDSPVLSSSRTDRIFEVMAADPNHEWLFDSSWNLEDNEDDTKEEGDLFGQSTLRIGDLDSDSENVDELTGIL